MVNLSKLLMIKHILVTVICLFLFSGAFPQLYSIKGSLSDTSNNQSIKLQNAVVSLLRSSDSILYKFGRTNGLGEFDIKNVRQGNYIMLVTHPEYADYLDIIAINAHTDVGNLYLFSRAVVLQNVIIRGSPIRMRGDTLAYIADSFKVKEGATVEDLLKRLPGIQVNAKGEITAQGERVQKVLVDGDEFFGDDPTLATQNMIARSVKEVQVFDKKSEQADFTGVDDGQKQKTINLKLKDEYKRGYFGKVNLAGGLPDRWENSAMINLFQDKRKFSLYGKMVNTNATGLGWRENNQYGGGIGVQTEISDDGGISIWSTNDEFGGQGNFGGEGLPRSWMAGASYADKWNENKNSVNAAYRYQKLITEGNRSTRTQTILPDTQYFNNEIAKNKASRWRHRANFKSDIVIDSLQSLTIIADGDYGESQSFSSLESEALTTHKMPVNSNIRNTSNNGSIANFNASILYKKKFAKKGRTLSVNVSERYSNNVSDGYLLSYLSFYNDGIFNSMDTTDQKKENKALSLSLDSRVAYTEPLGKNGIVEINAGYNLRNSDQQLLSYDKKNSKYETLNDFFSNDYTFNTGTSKAGLGYRYNYKKVVFGIGADIQHSNWKQTNNFNDSLRTYNFNNFFPKANFSYKLGQYSRVRFNYSGSTQAPSINQIQPVANNANPLSIAIGNPNLNQLFRQRFELGYNFYQVLKQQGLWANISFSPVNNDFSTRDIIDTSGRRIYQTVNVNGNYNFYAWVGYNFKWKKPEINLDFSFNPSFSERKNFVNGNENITNNNSYRFSIYANKTKEKKYTINFGLDATYNYGRSSIRPDVVTKYWTATPNLRTEFTLPYSIEISSDINYNWRQATAVFGSNNNTYIWNAAIEKKILKTKELKLGIRVNDILNQNIGFRRDISANYITERTYDVIKRYWAATLTYNFNKGPKKEEGW